MNRCLEAICGWIVPNDLQLNPDKTEVLLMGEGLTGEMDLSCSGCRSLHLKEQVHSLGLLLFACPLLNKPVEVVRMPFTGAAASDYPAWERYCHYGTHPGNI